MLIITALLKKFWPYLAGGGAVIIIFLGGLCLYRGYKIESLQKDVKMLTGEVDAAERALETEKESFEEMHKEFSSCQESLQEKEDDVKNLYKLCEQQKLDLSQLAENLKSEWKEWRDFKNEKIEGCPDFEAYKKQINDVTRELLK